MISIARCREILGDPDITDDEVIRLRYELCALADMSIEIHSRTNCVDKRDNIRSLSHREGMQNET